MISKIYKANLKLIKINFISKYPYLFSMRKGLEMIKRMMKL
jgi:flagellar biosynthesis protein FlhB